MFRGEGSFAVSRGRIFVLFLSTFQLIWKLFDIYVGCVKLVNISITLDRSEPRIKKTLSSRTDDKLSIHSFIRIIENSSAVDDLS